MPSPVIFYRGQRFSMLVVTEPETGLRSCGKRMIGVTCDCGAAQIVMGSDLTRGHTQSCGCTRRVNFRYEGPPVVHGLSFHPLYNTWNGIIQRCENPRDRAYKHYGARGICVASEWHDVTRFIADIESTIGARPAEMLESGHPAYTIDRIDNDGNYEPGNIRWATWIEQSRNKRPRTTIVSDP